MFRTIKKAARYTSFNILITFMALLLVSILGGGTVDITVISTGLLVVGLQIFVSNYPRVFSVYVPIEVMGVRFKKHQPYYSNYIRLFSPLLIILSFYSFGMAMLIFLAIGVMFSNAIYNLVLSKLYRGRCRAGYISQISSYNPEFGVYVSGLGNVSYQINQWISVLEKIDIPKVIFIRERATYRKMKKTGIPVIFMRSQKDVEDVYSSCINLKTILYPANTQKNTQSLRHFRLNHYFINHGESDKAVNQSKLLMAYDKLLVGGQLAEDRMREAGLPLRKNQVVHVGRPQAELLLDKIQSPKPIKTILYAPTWEGFVDNVNYSSVSTFGYKILKALVRDGRFKVLFKPHPYTGHRTEEQKHYLSSIKKLCNRKTMVFIDSMVGIHELMNQSDLMITDISSVLNEYLITNKPIVLCSTQGRCDEELRKEFPSTRAAYIVKDADDFMSNLEAIVEADPLWEKRSEVRKYSLGDPNESAMERFTVVIRNSVSSK